jgi:hypothetical protein
MVLPGRRTTVDDAPAIGRVLSGRVIVEVLGDSGGLVVMLEIDGDQFGDFHLVLKILLA